MAIAEERDNVNEIFDYATSKPLIAAWSDGFKEKTGGKSCGNLRAMHNAVSAGKLTALHFDDEQRAVAVCAKVIDEGEWQKVLQGVYTGFSFGGRAVKRWRDETLGAMRYTLQPVELSLADKPCVPSAVFEVVKTDGTTEHRQFKMGGNLVIKIQKNMDLTQFLELMQNVKEGLAADEATPENLLAAVENLVNVLTECTGSAKTAAEKEPPANPAAKGEEKAVESGCRTEKADLAAEIKKALAPLAQSLEAMQQRLEKVEKQPAAPKVYKTVPAEQSNPPADPAAALLEEIKKAQNLTTSAY